MDEIEMRLAAVETVLIEALAWVDPAALDDAAAAIRAGLDGAGEEERAIRAQALQLLEDARRRYSGPTPGIRV